MPADKPANEGYTPDPNLIAEVAAFETEFVNQFNFPDGVVYDKQMSDHVLSFYAKGADMRFFDFMTPLEWSGDELEQHFKDIMANYSGQIELLDMKIHAASDLAAVTSIQRMTGIGPKREPYTLVLRVTDILVRKDGSWKFVHQHVSIPVDWATGVADFQATRKNVT